MKTQRIKLLRPLPCHTVIARAIAVSLLFAPALAAAQAAYSEPGVVGNVDSWRTGEFKSDWGLAAIGADHAYARGLSGAGAAVGVYDDGTALWHKDLEGKTFSVLNQDAGCASRQHIGGQGACFYADGSVSFNYGDALTPEQLKALDNDVAKGERTADEVAEIKASQGFTYSTHGTHVAGTVGAHRNGSGTHGVAFGADLYTGAFSSDSYKNSQALLEQDGALVVSRAPTADAVRTMHAAMAAKGVHVINNSWGLTTEPTSAAAMDKLAADPDFGAITKVYADSAKRHDIVQVFAAGNDDGKIAGIYASLPRYYADAESHWLSVVNLKKDLSRDASSSICGLSKAWCISAPGTDITSTIGGGKIDGTVLRDREGNVVGLDVTSEERSSLLANYTGTSMAAPHVSGGLVLVMERFPYMDSAQARDVLLTTARDLGAPGVDENYGWGLMDLKKAIDGPGQMRVDTHVVMNTRAGGAKVWSGEAWDDWRNDIGGTGKLTKSGSGWLRLSGNNTFAGASIKEGVLELDGTNKLTGGVQVQGGSLLLNGSLSGVQLDVQRGVARVQGKVERGVTTVAAQGRIEGTGTLADTRIAGTIAPGRADVGTLHIEGDYTQLPGSIYEVDTKSPGRSDLIDVRGKADLQGGQVTADMAGVDAGQSYRILAAGSILGKFAGVVADANVPFLAMRLSQTTSQVNLDVVRGKAFTSAAETINQRDVAAAADKLANGSVLFKRLSHLTQAQATNAFDRIGAEAHASQRSVLVEQGQRMAETAASRVRTVQSTFANQAEGATGVWVDAQSRGGHLNGDGNAARVNYHGDFLAAGADYQFGSGWSVGAMGATGEGDMRIRDRDVRSQAKSRYFGLYGGKTWGAFGLRAGWLMSEHRIRSDRQVAYGRYSESNVARYTDKGQQGFLEAGYEWDVTDSIALEPYALWSRVEVKNPQFQETGGLTALDVDAGRSRVDFTSLGLRLSANLSHHAEQDWLQVGGGIAYRHASGDLASAATASWAEGGNFTSWGAPLGKSATLVNLGVTARLAPRLLLELGYDGQFASDGRDNAVNARLSMKF